MAIHAIVGLPGMGKTLYGVHMLRRVKGRDRMSNLFPRSNEWRFVLWEEMKRAGHGVVLIDEAHMWFSSRELADQVELAAWQQHRKQGLDLWYTVQDINRVDKAVRELTAYMHLVRKFGDFVMVATYFPEDLNKNPPGKAAMRKIAWITPGDYSSYWTEQIVGYPDGRGFELGRLARRKENIPQYAPSPGKLRGKELRYVVPSQIVVRCDHAVKTLEWKGTNHDLAALLSQWRAFGWQYDGPMYSITYVFDGPGGRVKWSHADYLAVGHPVALAVGEAFSLGTPFDAVAGDPLADLARRWQLSGGTLPSSEPARPRRVSRSRVPV